MRYMYIKKLKVAVAHIFQIKEIQHNNTNRLAKKKISYDRIKISKKNTINAFNFLHFSNFDIASKFIHYYLFH